MRETSNMTVPSDGARTAWECMAPFAVDVTEMHHIPKDTLVLEMEGKKTRPEVLQESER